MCWQCSVAKCGTQVPPELMLLFRLKQDGLQLASVQALLQIKNLTIHAGENSVVDNVSLSINPGEMLGLVGESGCGKSMTALSILGLLPAPAVRASSGSILYRDQNILSLTEQQLDKIRGRKVAMIFQEPMTSLNPVFTIGAQIIEVLYLHTSLPRRVKAKAGRLKASALLSRVGFADAQGALERYPHQLSGGQRQRVMIAMALACEPSVLIADEPTTALDVTVQAQILELLNTLSKQSGLAVLLITHDLGVVQHYCDRVAIMYSGQIVELGNAQAVFAQPKHRYTQALLQTIPASNKAGSRLPAITGSVPALGQQPAGCRFNPRCQAAIEPCIDQQPQLDGTEHAVRCWNPA